ncbi:MAG TPA: LysR substrate-binding domain-containing protein, partial [Myxococcota bacterium]
MRAFAAVASAASFTAAGRALAMPKQTLSRRIAALEAALGVQLLHRTTRRLHLTAAGAVYARRCAELARLAADANKDAQDALATRGTLRITADPVFGEAFVADLVVAYARAWPEVRVDLVLTRRRVDLLEEGFDVAFRVGFVNDAALTGVRIGPAAIRVCASPAYVKRYGRPRTPEELAHHECVLVGDDSEA